MATLQDRLNQISPYNTVSNPTGSTKVLNMPERKPTNDGQIENYRIIWTNDNGETYKAEVIQLVAKDGEWYFATWPGCINNTQRTVEDLLEAKVAEWWAASAVSLGYSTRGRSHINNLEQRLGQVSCTKVLDGPKIEIHTWYFLKVGAQWVISQGKTEKLYDEVI